MGLARWATAAAIASIAHSPARADPQRLSGIVIAGTDRVAIFAGEPGAPMLTVRVGDWLGDERIVAIDAGGVQFDGPAGSRLVTIANDTLTRAALAPVVARPPLIDPYWRERETENDQ